MQIQPKISESGDVKFSRHTFDSHKDSSAAQESHLISGDEFEIMTNSLTYDMDKKSLNMIAKSLANGVIYYYYLEKNSRIMQVIKKFCIALLNKIIDLGFSSSDSMSLIRDHLHIYWLPDGKFIYSFSLFNRPKSNIIDHCTFYFVKRQTVLYEAFLENLPTLVDKLKVVFTAFREYEKVDICLLANITTE